MTKKTVLTIAGSDSCCGAGIQADIKTISQLGAYGVCAITALTAQNTKGVQFVNEVSPDFVRKQIDTLACDLRIDAVKSGMLVDEAIVNVVAGRIKHYGFKYFVIDPVIISKNGKKLLTDRAVKLIIKELAPLAYLITPNILEAELLTNRKICNLGDMRAAARTISKFGPKNVLIKGGHLSSYSSSGQKKVARDILFDGNSFEFFDHEFIPDRDVHGTGCTYSAAITTELAKGSELSNAVNRAKEFISLSIENSINIGNGGYGLISF